MKRNIFFEKQPTLICSVLPVASLLVALVVLIVAKGASSVSDYGPFVLLGASVLALLLSLPSLDMARLTCGMKASSRQILPALPILFCIALLSTTWMLGGIVPTFIHYGLQFLNPMFFLVSVCMVCGCISIFTGSSWTTIATVGVAFMGIGGMMGYDAPWIAGAVISGAYFGDKVSPLSDTTVVASSSCGVDLFTHIRYMMFTTVPSMLIALSVFMVAGLTRTPVDFVSGHSSMLDSLHSEFNVTPLSLFVPAITIVMIAFRVNTIVTLAVSSLLGVVSIIAFQPQIQIDLSFFGVLWGGAHFETSDAAFNELASTSGVLGMLPTIFLVSSAMMFGGVMIGTGMLETISQYVTEHLKRRRSIIGSTVCGGLLLNSFTADQYLSLIIGANTFRDVYEKKEYDKKILSRTLEDSVSVTSVLIPWNSCGLTQSAVLGVSTLLYAPYCVFNYLSPIMSFVVSAGLLGFKKRIWKKLKFASN